MRLLLIAVGALVAIAGVAVALLAADAAPRDAMYGWHMAVMFGLTTALGALFLLMLGHAAQASWLIVMRRLLEHIVGTLPILALLFVPSVVGMSHLFPWAEGGIEMHHDVAEKVAKKRDWLNDAAFVWRSAGYLAAFVTAGELLRHWSRKQDRAESDAARTRYGRRMRVLSCVGFAVLGALSTFAFFDWVMSLEPAWYSTIYSAAVLAGGFTAAVGLLALTLVVSRFDGAVKEDHRHALGRVLFASICFWAYLHFCQYLLIWIADLPEEVKYFTRRQEHGWQWIGLAIVLGHFVVPFFLLLSRTLKERPASLGFFGAWIVLFHLLAVFYLVVPAHRVALRVHFADLAAVLGVVASMLVFAALRAPRLAKLPVGDPGLRASLSYSSS